MKEKFLELLSNSVSENEIHFGVKAAGNFVSVFIVPENVEYDESSDIVKIYAEHSIIEFDLNGLAEGSEPGTYINGYAEIAF